MPPATIGELMSLITSSKDSAKVNELFVKNIKEIFSHSRADITNHLVHLGNKEQFSLRTHLFNKVTQNPSLKVKEQLESHNIDLSVPDISDILCKRYNETRACEDIYCLGCGRR